MKKSPKKKLFKQKMNNNPEDLPEAPVHTYLPTVTSSMKWWLALFLGILFYIVAFGGTYNVTNAVWTGIGLPTYLKSSGCPNAWGVLLHAFIFVLFIRLILW